MGTALRYKIHWRHYGKEHWTLLVATFGTPMLILLVCMFAPNLNGLSRRVTEMALVWTVASIPLGIRCINDLLVADMRKRVQDRVRLRAVLRSLRDD